MFRKVYLHSTDSVGKSMPRFERDPPMVRTVQQLNGFGRRLLWDWKMRVRISVRFGRNNH